MKKSGWIFAVLLMVSCNFGKQELEPTIFVSNDDTIIFNGEMIDLADFETTLKNYRMSVDSSMWKYIVVNLEIEKDISMGTLQDVKRALRKNDLLKVNYKAEQ